MEEWENEDIGEWGNGEWESEMRERGKWFFRSERMSEWECGEKEWGMGLGPVGRFVVSDKGVATEVEVTAVVARLADHLWQPETLDHMIVT